ncbi:hypothetical protein ACKKBG_A12420 [Auxenochlorella protothecoides x Auxenochlorella symbiontica]
MGMASQSTIQSLSSNQLRARTCLTSTAFGCRLPRPRRAVPAPALGDDLRAAAASTASHMRGLIEEQELRERLRTAGTGVAQGVKGGLARTGRAFQSLDSRFSIRQRLGDVAAQAHRGAVAVDRQLGLRQRAGDWWEDFLRLWPARRQRLQALMRTPLGKGLALGLFLVGCRTGLVMLALNLLFAATWLTPLALMLLARGASQTAQRAAAQQAQRQAAQQTQQRTMFDAMLRSMRRGGGKAARQPQGSVVDVEWDTVDG